MGKKCDTSKTREYLMKHLKKLASKLEDSPPCQVKQFPRSSCGCCLVAKSPKCPCYLVPNCCSNSLSLVNSQSCGPFPDSCTTILPTRKCTPSPSSQCYLCSNVCVPSCCRCIGCKKCDNSCSISCCKCCCCSVRKCCSCKRKCCCSSPKCICCKSLIPPKMANCGNCCCQKCSCKCMCRPKRCRIKYKRIPVGCLCCACKSICVPKTCSDSALLKRKLRKSLRCSKSVELRGGFLYRGCDCDKKNGLQDRCLRSCCINNPKCRTEPASCHCSKFSCGKHLHQRYGRKRCVSYTCYICDPLPTIQYFPMPCCPCRCCCRNKQETECQCQPATCEVQCCCQPCAIPCSEPCLPCHPPTCEAQCCCQTGPTTCQEPCSPLPEPCSSFPQPCEANNKPCGCYPEVSYQPPNDTNYTCSPCGRHNCVCNECIQCSPEIASCAIEYCVPRAR